MILNADINGYDTSKPTHISIYCNTALYILMTGFRADYAGPNIYDGMNYKFKMIQNRNGLNIFKVNSTYSTIQLYQEYSSGALFSPISSIVFCTSMIPVIPSAVAKPVVYNGDNRLTVGGNNNNISSMITDFEVQDNNGYGFCGSISYIFRLVNIDL